MGHENPIAIIAGRREDFIEWCTRNNTSPASRSIRHVATVRDAAGCHFSGSEYVSRVPGEVLDMVREHTFAPEEADRDV